MSIVELVVCLTPLLALVCALLLGRYPGECALRRRLARRGSRPRSGRIVDPTQRAVHALVPRGGALLAHALAGRAPPLGSQ